MSILKSGTAIALWTLVSRISGLIRELFVAGLFGTSWYADAVNIAFKLPNLFRRILGEGALTSVFVPIYSAKLEVSADKANNFANEVYTLLLIILVILTLLMQLFMPNLMLFFAPGFASEVEKFSHTVLLCQITMPYILLISLSAFIGGILNSHKKFTAFAITPIILNIVIIICCSWSNDKITSTKVVCYGIIVGGVLQLSLMLSVIRSNNITLQLQNVTSFSKSSRQFLKNMLPAILTNGVIQINLFISQSISSFVTGMISTLSYADRVYQLPLSIIGACFSTILLPSLAKLYKQQRLVEAINLQSEAVRLGLLLSLPCAGGIIIIAHPMTHLLYERGAFLADDTIKTAQAIAAFSLGLPAFVLGKIITPIFYAKFDVKTPFRITIYTVISNIIINIVLMQSLQHVGIALGTSISSWFNVFLLSYYCRKNQIPILQSSIKFYMIKILATTLMMMAAAKYLIYITEPYLYSNSGTAKFCAITLVIVLAATVYFALSIFFKTIKIHDLKNLFSSKNML